MRLEDGVDIDTLRHLTVLVGWDFVEHELAFVVLSHYRLAMLTLFMSLLRLISLLNTVCVISLSWAANDSKRSLGSIAKMNLI